MENDIETEIFRSRRVSCGRPKPVSEYLLCSLARSSCRAARSGCSSRLVRFKAFTMGLFFSTRHLNTLLSSLKPTWRSRSRSKSRGESERAVRSKRREHHATRERFYVVNTASLFQIHLHRTEIGEEIRLHPRFSTWPTS